MHVYWSKKPHTAIRQYVRHYTRPGDIVLDPFCGSGGTALAALLDGRKAIAIDRSPAATFITKNHCTPVDPDELREAFEQVKTRGPARDRLALRDAVRSLRRQGDDGIHRLQPGLPVPALPAEDRPLRLRRRRSRDRGRQGEDRQGLPELPGQGLHGSDPITEREVRLRPGEGGLPLRERMQADREVSEHNDVSRRKRSFFEKYDLGKIREIESKEIPHWYPRHKMMNVEDDSKPVSEGCWLERWQ